MEDKKWKVIDGFLFVKEENISLAKEELDKITYLEERMNYNNPRSVLVIYKKMLENKIFKSPSGICYLHKIFEYLCESDINEEDIPPIPIYTMQDESIPKQEYKDRTIKIKAQKRIKQRKYSLRIAWMINVALILMILAMFFITATSEQPNVLNYKTVLENKYASWEQELTERENILREKEK